MKFILDEVFEEAGRHIDDYLKCVKLEPMYRPAIRGRAAGATTAREAMLQQARRAFPREPRRVRPVHDGGEAGASN